MSHVFISFCRHGQEPSLDALRRLAVALSVSADLLLFDSDERTPDRLARAARHRGRRGTNS